MPRQLLFLCIFVPLQQPPTDTLAVVRLSAVAEEGPYTGEAVPPMATLQQHVVALLLVADDARPTLNRGAGGAVIKMPGGGNLSGGVWRWSSACAGGGVYKGAAPQQRIVPIQLLQHIILYHGQLLSLTGPHAELYGRL